jgi:hypothetical protein
MVPTDFAVVAFTKRGYLIIGADLARAYLPTDALQHVSSTHVQENLWEAVALYEEILPELPARDQTRKGRVLANQGNALAHLGAFSRAVPRLNEARAIFALTGDDDSTAAIDLTLAEIAERVSAAEAPYGHP